MPRAAEHPAVSPWTQGSRTVTQAQAETGLSRDKLFDLMGAGAVRWKVNGGRGTRLLSWSDLVAYLESLPDGRGAGR